MTDGPGGTATDSSSSSSSGGERGRGEVGRGRGRGRERGEQGEVSAATTTTVPDGTGTGSAADNDAIRRGLEAISRIERAADHGDEDNGDAGSAKEERKGVVEDADGGDDADGDERRRSRTAAAASTSIEWITTIELDYASPKVEAAGTTDDEGGAPPVAECLCFNCGAPQPPPPASPFSKCGRCRVARYCSRDCQVADYKRKPSDPPVGPSGIPNRPGHRRTCAAYSRVGPSMNLTDDRHKCSVREEVLRKIRFYSSPYAVHHAHNRGLGRGFLFLQSNSTLAELSLPGSPPISSDGRVLPLPRSVVLNYLTMGEYDTELCRDDFEMASVRGALTTAVEKYDDRTEVVYLMRFGCGHVAVGRVPMVPDLGICRSLAADYFGGGQQRGGEALQLNLDDM